MSVNTDMAAQIRANISSCPICPAGSATTMSRESAKSMCKAFQAETHKVKGVEYRSYPYCHKTCKGRDLSKYVTFNDDLVKEYKKKLEVVKMSSSKAGFGVCPDCSQERSLTHQFGMKICSQCAIVRGMAKNWPEAVIRIVKDVAPSLLVNSDNFNESMVPASELKKQKTLYEKLKKQHQVVDKSRSDLLRQVNKLDETIKHLEMRNHDIKEENEALKKHRADNGNYVDMSVYVGMEALLIHRSRTVHDLLEENVLLAKHSIMNESETGRDIEVQQEAIKALDSENQKLSILVKELSAAVEDLSEKVERYKNISASVMDCNRKTQTKADIAWCIADGVASGRVIGIDQDVLKAIREAV